MSLQAIDIATIEALYLFVESSGPRTGLILDSDATNRIWARAVAAQCRDVRWLYPCEPLSEQLLRHLSNLAHEPVSSKGFVLIEKGRVLKAVDVDAVNGSAQPHRLGMLVQQVFTAKRVESAKSAPRRSDSAVAAATDPYSVLGAAESDSDQELKHKYKQMLMQYHPDRVAHLGQELRELAASKTTQINIAFAAIRTRRGARTS